MKKRTTFILASMVFMGQGLALAGLPSLGQLGLGGSATTTSSITGLNNTQQKVSNTYVKATQTIANALTMAGNSFGLKNELTAKLGAVNSLQSGELNDNNITTVRQAINAAAQLLQQKLQGGSSLSKQSTQSFQASLADMAGGIQTMKGLIPEAGNLVKQAQGTLTTAPLQDKLKVQGIVSTALALSKNLPVDLSAYQGILSTLAQYATTHSINVPQVVGSLMTK